MVSLLIGAGADIEAADVKGQTPLHLAAKCPGPEGIAVVRELIAAGACVHTFSNTGELPLDTAIAFSRSGARNRESSKPVILALRCATAPASLDLLYNDMVGPYVRKIIMVYILSVWRCTMSDEVMRLPVEIWSIILLHVTGCKLLQTVWRLERSREQARIRQRAALEQARASATESMDLFNALADNVKSKPKTAFTPKMRATVSM